MHQGMALETSSEGMITGRQRSVEGALPGQGQEVCIACTTTYQGCYEGGS